jgi:uridine kinase
MTEDVKVRPFLIGVVDGGLTNEIIKQLEKNLEGYPICTISITNYYKDLSEDNNIKPEIIDFDLLLSDLAKMRNKEPCEVPIYDFKNKKRSEQKKKVESCQIIILEGLFCFYDPKICNLMDLKIFIDTDNDIRLARTISKGIAEGKTSLIDIIQKFHKTIKPAYNNFISPTKKKADIILPNAIGHETAVKIITNYLKLLFDKVSNNKDGSIFSFLNEIVDPKYIFFQDKIIVKNEKPIIDFLKDVFEDFIANNQDEEFIEVIRKKLLDMILSLLVDYFRKNTKYSENLPVLEKLIFDSDDISNINFENCNIVFFFKTAILNENDIKVPQYILSKNKDCQIIISSIFLAPKFAHYLTNDQMNSIIFATLYFNEFFVKYDNIIKKDETVFNEKELEKTFKKIAKENFNYSS